MSSDKAKALHVQVAEKLIEQLQVGTAPGRSHGPATMFLLSNCPTMRLPETDIKASIPFP